LPIAKLKGAKTINAMITNASPVKFLKENWNRSRLTFPFSDVVLANSWAGINAYKANKRKSQVIYNGFSPSRAKKLLSEAEIRQQFGIPTPKVVGMVGAMHNRKDYATYIQAAIKTLRKEQMYLLSGWRRTKF
ncbi:MAG: hypothetical protein HC896_11540, partial [Bacteroidales bacterium]|nr:hypothetical protein [Bacteroidales bacterium]